MNNDNYLFVSVQHKGTEDSVKWLDGTPLGELGEWHDIYDLAHETAGECVQFYKNTFAAAPCSYTAFIACQLPEGEYHTNALYFIVLNIF